MSILFASRLHSVCFLKLAAVTILRHLVSGINLIYMCCCICECAQAWRAIVSWYCNLSWILLIWRLKIWSSHSILVGCGQIFCLLEATPVNRLILMVAIWFDFLISCRCQMDYSIDHGGFSCLSPLMFLLLVVVLCDVNSNIPHTIVIRKHVFFLRIPASYWILVIVKHGKIACKLNPIITQINYWRCKSKVKSTSPLKEIK